MSDLSVGSLGVSDVLNAIWEGRWEVPVFQRDFVWSIAQIEQLAESVVRSRPIGMATLWELNDDAGIRGRPISIQDTPNVKEFSSTTRTASGNRFAILDGRQRCTALAIAFGGLSTTNGKRNTTGRCFLNLDAGPDEPWVEFFRKKQIEEKQLVTTAEALRRGWMPLAQVSPASDIWDLSTAWSQHLIDLYSDAIYPAKSKPDDATLDRRKLRIMEAQKGVNNVKLATYAVGSTFDLADICDIFEVLNTSGTQVSTVDLIHSFVYQDTNTELEIRSWIETLGATEGAEGWASKDSRPERIAQSVTAAYVGLQSPDKPEPRNIAGKAGGAVTSIKSSDLLRTPTGHWKAITSEASTQQVATILEQFQGVVAEGRFPMAQCPYPATASVYMGLRWSRDTEEISKDECWTVDDLNRLFRPFFWATALTGRYDQGFLSQVGTDIKELRSILRLRESEDEVAWLTDAQKKLELLIGEALPTEEELVERIYQGTATGALRLALRLPLWTTTDSDLITKKDISYTSDVKADLHHIWPKAWIKDNRMGGLRNILDEAADNPGWNRVDCVANLVPLSEESNKEWRATNPGAYLKKKKITFAALRETFENAFIDQECFELLMSGSPEDVGPFQEKRARLIAKKIIGWSTVSA